jgi:UDP-3-O-[3-hydroxymyristoyl] glucosamine N-acyltransferase
MTELSGAAVDLPATIAPTALIGRPGRPRLDGGQNEVNQETRIGEGAWIGDFCVIGQGATIGARSIVQEYSYIQAGVKIGDRVLVRPRTSVHEYAQIGDDCIIYGLVGERVVIGNNCRVFGQFIHKQLQPTMGWDDPGSEEESATVRDGAFVGWDAIIVGPVVISERAYVCAGALVTRDVPSGHIAYGRNQVRPYRDWPGDLRNSSFFTSGS